jgi:CRISPR/Cas system CSM-associated protein Csm3 (group 7 of RAMP superfamily)
MMRIPRWIQVELLSDTTFSAGEGTPGVVDIEVEHSAEGLPIVSGKTLRGLLRDAWLSMAGAFPSLAPAARRVFGVEKDCQGANILHLGDGQLEETTRTTIRAALQRPNHPLSPQEVLDSLCDIRWQTAEDRMRRAPADKTLRSVRVVLKGVALFAPLHWSISPGVDEVRVLALSALTTRQAGLGRHRGRGHVRLTLDGDLAFTQNLARGETP